MSCSIVGRAPERTAEPPQEEAGPQGPRSMADEGVKGVMMVDSPPHQPLNGFLNSNCFLFFFLRLMKGRVDLQKTLPHLHQPTRPLWPGFVLWRFCRPLRGSTNDGATTASRSLPRRHLALILTANSISEMPSEESKRKTFSFYISDF